MSLSWIRLKTQLRTDPRMVRLMWRLEPDAGRCLLFLIMAMAEVAPLGILHGEDAEALVEHYGDWRGKKGALVGGLLETGWIRRLENSGETPETGLEVVDWEDFAPAHVAEAKAVSARKEDAARKRADYAAKKAAKKAAPENAGETPEKPDGEKKEKRRRKQTEESRSSAHASVHAHARDEGEGQESPGESVENPTSSLRHGYGKADFEAMIEAWNRDVDSFAPRCKSVTEAREKAFARFLWENGGHPGWLALIARINASDFLCGRTEKGRMRPAIDWVLKPANLTKILEGNYDNDDRPQGAVVRDLRKPVPAESVNPEAFAKVGFLDD